MRQLARHPGAFVTLAVLLLASVWACTSGQPVLVVGNDTTGNITPSLEITFPVGSLSINQGARFDVVWDDSDVDSAAKISFSLVSTVDDIEIIVVSNIEENDNLADDNFSISTALVPIGTYWLRGTISDSINPPVSTFALLDGSLSSRVVLTITEPGTSPLNTPPRVAVLLPSFSQGVAQDDSLTVVVQPSKATPAETIPYDDDSAATLYLLLDLDDDPENDDPLLPDNTASNQILLQRTVDIAEAEYEAQTFTLPIDLGAIPAREDGSPYYIRATIIDESNPPVHAYATGTINIVRSATGSVDLAKVGKTLSGSRMIGFNPGSRLGTSMTSTGDFDDDGVEDFLLVAQYGNPRNFGNVGEAYLIYGMDQARYGGDINVNTVSSDISGTIFEAPPNRLSSLHTDELDDPQGINSVAVIDDITGDARPDLLFGMSLVDGIFQGRDDDPGDAPDTMGVEIELSPGLYQRSLNNISDSSIDDDYDGLTDTYIDRTLPNSFYGTSTTMDVLATTTPDDTNPADRFARIEFEGARNTLTTLDPDNVSDLDATLVFSLTTSDIPSTESFSVRQLNQDVTNTTTYSDFGVDGPTEDADYETDELEVSIVAGDSQISVNVTDTIQAILDGELVTPRWIIVPLEEVDMTIFSSEAGGDPKLTIRYNESLEDGILNLNCYPDSFVNNFSDGSDDPNVVTADSSLESCGCVFLVSSENRDSNPFITGYPRLEDTTVALELSGQEDVGPSIGYWENVGFEELDDQVGGDILHLASDTAGGEIRGSRIQAGWWEYYNFGDVGSAAPRRDYFGRHVSSMPDWINNDLFPEIVISAPLNELYMSQLNLTEGTADYTIYNSTAFDGSIVVMPGENYTENSLHTDPDGRNYVIPSAAQQGRCSSSDPERRWGPMRPTTTIEVYAEDIRDYLGGAEYAGDVNIDGVPDLVCGAPLNDHPNGWIDTGAAYIIYGRLPAGNVPLGYLDDPAKRPPTLRIRGETAGDQIGFVQTHGMDINGDRVDDVFIASPHTDYNVDVPDCRVAGATINQFNACKGSYGDEVFEDDACKIYDYDFDRDIDADDRNIYDCLLAEDYSNCCPVDNGFVGVIFGDVDLDGDRDISQIGTSDLPGIKFYGASPGDRAGLDVASAGDFNRDGFGDLLITAPGVDFVDDNGRDRVGVAYLIFGGTHLTENCNVADCQYSLAEVGTTKLPGMIIQSPYVAGSPNEAPIETAALLGDINNDGFDDIGIGIPRADFVDSTLPQDPNDPGTDPNIGRRPDDGNIYIIYGNNTGTNR